MPLDRHLTPDFQQNTQVPRTVNTHTELTGGPAYPDCKPPPGRSVTDSQADVCRRLVDDKVSPSSWLDFRVDPQVVVDVGLVVEQAPPRGCLVWPGG